MHAIVVLKNGNVKYELEELELLIASDIENSVITQTSLQQEVDRIKSTFINEVFTFGDERHLERYIQYHQQALIRLMDKTMNTIQDYGRRDYYTKLEELLTFVESHFAKYFDQDAKAPEAYILMVRNDVRRNMKKLQKVFDKKNIDPRLTESTLYIIRKILTRSSRDITYRKVMYAKVIQRELFRLLQSIPPEKDSNSEIRLLLYYLNYNSIKFFTYHTQYISTLLAGAETHSDKIEKLSFLLKQINQAQVKPGICYNQNAPPIKSQLNSYISEEIDYQERLQLLSQNPYTSSAQAAAQNFKIKLELSVSQYALLIKLFVESKIIQNNNITELLRSLSKLVVTKKSENISYDSFRAKFYNVERSTKESIRLVLTNLINHLDRNI